MTEALVIARCRCGKVELEARGEPIISAICHCDDCQEGARQLEALPGAGPVRDAAGGTACVLYRKDRLRQVRGAELLEGHKLKPDSATNRVVASCCNTAIMVTFDDARHWVPLYRGALSGDVPEVQWRICTRFQPEGVALPDDVPAYAMYPLAMMGRLATSGLATLLRL